MVFLIINESPVVAGAPAHRRFKADHTSQEFQNGVERPEKTF